MERRPRNTALALITIGLAIAGSPGTVAAESHESLAELTAEASALDDPKTMSVVIVNHVGVPQDVMREAQSVASQIFLAAGVKVLWIDTPRHSASPRRFRLTVIMVSAPPARLRLHEHAMGHVPVDMGKSGSIAYAFYARVKNLARQIDMKPAVVLGHVMAHEMGHVLLGRGSHASTGIMRAEWDKSDTLRAASGRLMFTSDEAAVIRARAAELSGALQLSTVD